MPAAQRAEGATLAAGILQELKDSGLLSEEELRVFLDRLRNGLGSFSLLNDHHSGSLVQVERAVDTFIEVVRPVSATGRRTR
ncbi:hypothetical protein ACIGXA_33955 [Streptomyces fildesensis]|uniref:Uncharacterized protein n=1 Tax=Streptomyces fildesensis TaxID=375757 RepID=A0ABW8CGH4_9ACTN